jgi:hypothetical protein
VNERSSKSFNQSATSAGRLRRVVLGAAGGALVAAGVAGWWSVLGAGAFAGGLAARFSAILGGEVCAFSERQIHSQMAVRVAVEGESGGPVTACCLRCAINQAHQTGRLMRIISVTDFNTGKQLSATQAVYVVGAGVAPCADHSSVIPNGERRPLRCTWDRCLPSAVAFADLRDAQAFQARHGGQIARFAELTRASTVVAAR